jgi:hypothetical protein
MRATCPVVLVLLDLITLIVFGVNDKRVNHAFLPQRASERIKGRSCPPFFCLYVSSPKQLKAFQISCSGSTLKICDAGVILVHIVSM